MASSKDSFRTDPLEDAIRMHFTEAGWTVTQIARDGDVPTPASEDMPVGPDGPVLEQWCTYQIEAKAKGERLHVSVTCEQIPYRNATPEVPRFPVPVWYRVQLGDDESGPVRWGYNAQAGPYVSYWQIRQDRAGFALVMVPDASSIERFRVDAHRGESWWGDIIFSELDSYVSHLAQATVSCFAMREATTEESSFPGVGGWEPLDFHSIDEPPPSNSDTRIGYSTWPKALSLLCLLSIASFAVVARLAPWIYALIPAAVGSIACVMWRRYEPRPIHESAKPKVPAAPPRPITNPYRSMPANSPSDEGSISSKAALIPSPADVLLNDPFLTLLQTSPGIGPLDPDPIATDTLKVPSTDTRGHSTIMDVPIVRRQFTTSFRSESPSNELKIYAKFTRFDVHWNNQVASNARLLPRSWLSVQIWTIYDDSPVPVSALSYDDVDAIDKEGHEVGYLLTEEQVFNGRLERCLAPLMAWSSKGQNAQNQS